MGSSGKWGFLILSCWRTRAPRKQRKMNAINYVFILIAGAAVASAGYYCKTGFDVPACLLIEAAKLPPGPQATQDGRRVDCLLCQARAVARRIRDDLPANQVYKPVCVGRKFAHQQYNEYKNEVFCVEIDGTEILGSRQKGKNGNCKKFPRKGSKPKPKTVQPTQPALCMRKRRKAVRAKSAYVPVCKGRDFDVKQCVGKWCWCASAEGDVVPITFHRKGSLKPPNCAGHRAFKFSCKGKKGTQPHPTDCSRYVQCTPVGTFHCSCVGGMKFDRTEGVCNFKK